MFKSYISTKPELRRLATLSRYDDEEPDCLDVLLHHLANSSSRTSLKDLTIEKHMKKPSSILFATLRTAALSTLLSAVDHFEYTDDFHVDTSFLPSLQNVVKLDLCFFRGTTDTLLEIARCLVRGDSQHLVDFALSLSLAALTLATEPDLVELAELTSGRPFSSVKNAKISLYGDYEDLAASGAQALEVLARAWPLISQDAHADLTVHHGSSEIWEWSRKENGAKAGENSDADVEAETSFWQGEGKLLGFKAELEEK
ncbi:uncharacterized protein BXZ73DRAFT_99206 [Epithele typhae]|uniref:uncharacterized protein n=1 Tax=Epithele typhae TaxID=378194 RepID=UPI002007EBE6|nr:uncharacterized protein BXZ73DRAFT_99206 [Epithele typhae]KAH9940210.1 hypothetical protein BXZ73DRAFT_99206 [Epithele typhae]